MNRPSGQREEMGDVTDLVFSAGPETGSSVVGNQLHLIADSNPKAESLAKLRLWAE